MAHKAWWGPYGEVTSWSSMPAGANPRGTAPGPDLKMTSSQRLAALQITAQDILRTHCRHSAGPCVLNHDMFTEYLVCWSNTVGNEVELVGAVFQSRRCS